MGRPSEGWKIGRKKGRRCFNVRFSHEGRDYDLGTGEELEDAAARAAARIYAEVLSGTYEPRARGRAPVHSRPLGAVGLDWLNDAISILDRETAKTYSGYLTAHFVPFFRTVEAAHDVTTQAAYIRKRLGEVKATSIKKELGALRGLLAFAYEIPRRSVKMAELPERATGKAHKRGKRTRTPLSPKEARAILEHIPLVRTITVRAAGTGLGRKGSYCFRAPVRARVVLSYETSLRPATLDAISVPEHYELGATTLRITDEIDKARFGRVVPLTKRARRYLRRVVLALGPGYVGPIFDKFRYRKTLRNAARAAGLSPDRVRTLHPYDLRAAALTHWAETGNLPATQWMAGHKKISTTAIYAQGSLRAAQDMIGQ